MAYHIEKGTNDIVINGFEQGIASSPYQGIGDLKNINTTSIPQEASVNFATSQISPPSLTVGTVTSVNGSNVLTFTGATGLENMRSIVFSASGLTIGGVSAGVRYYVHDLSGNTFDLYSDYAGTNKVLATNGVGTFGTVVIQVNPSSTTATPKFFTYDAKDSAYFMLTDTGDLWSNIITTPSGYWTYCGASGTTDGLGQGAGLQYYQSYDGKNSYVFVFRNQTVDYFIVKLAGVTTYTWVYGWNHISGSGSNSLTTLITASAALQTSTTFHNSILAYYDIVYFCDGIYVDEFYEVLPTLGVGTAPILPYDNGFTYNPGDSVTYNNSYYTNILMSTGNLPTNATYWSPVAFDPTNPYTYVYVSNRLLPSIDSSQCLAFLGTTLMIGGKNNLIYVWDTTSPSFNNIIPLAEFNVLQLVSVNTNLFIFVGNRGRIYITNGSQAQLFQKIPDFLSGTVEPYFIWGGATSNKNQLYFSFNVTTNSGSPLTTYGGLWAISLDTNPYGVDTNKAIRMTNTLSYQTTTYQGYAPAIIPNFASAPAGMGLYIGWTNNSSGTGIDTTTSAPYAGGTVVAVGLINSDYIPIGTYLKPNTSSRVEFKLAVPMVAGESVQLFYRQKLSSSFTAIGAAITTSTQGFNGYSWAYTSVNFQNSQWVQIQAILTSTASSPSYCRLTELRISSM